MKNLITSSAPFFFPFALLAQGEVDFQCGANEFHRVSPSITQQPDYLERVRQTEEQLEAFTRSFDGAARGGGGYVIPVVFHIIHENGPENIQDSQIHDAMRILNEDFNRMNADWDNVRSEFLQIVADVGVEFRLATKDPSGNCTNGITRTVSSLTNEGEENMKALISWPRNKYMQVWVAASAGGAAGYTFKPGAANWMPEEDGIVIQHTYTGSTGTSSPNRSRALTHEVGHWLNLDHTWGGSNDPGLASNCEDDDNVNDTPNTIGWTSCNLSGATCGSALDNVENYMEYAYCSKMFTQGQATRMLAALNSSTAQRNQLWQLENLINTGVNGNATLCEARFSSDINSICGGMTVQFVDESFHNVATRNWSFPGGEPAASTEQNPQVTYAQSGTYPVSLTVSDGSSSVSTTTESFIVVAANPGLPGPYSEGFETATGLDELAWTVTNTNGDNTFAVTTAAAFTGAKSVRIANSASMEGRIDQLLSPTIDMSNASDILLSFQCAFARRIAGNDDRLRIFVSNDCGQTWSLRRQLFGSSTLATAANASGSFVPSSADQWDLVEVTTISSDYHVSDFRFRLEFESDGGNNLYIDNININGFPVGVDELITSTSGLSVFPNPATAGAEVLFSLDGNGPTRLDVMDVTGRLVHTVHNGSLAAGQHRLPLPVDALGSGVYFIRLQQSGSQKAARFSVR